MDTGSLKIIENFYTGWNNMALTLKQVFEINPHSTITAQTLIDVNAVIATLPKMSEDYKNVFKKKLFVIIMLKDWNAFDRKEVPATEEFGLDFVKLISRIYMDLSNVSQGEVTILFNRFKDILRLRNEESYLIQAEALETYLNFVYLQKERNFVVENYYFEFISKFYFYPVPVY